MKRDILEVVVKNRLRTGKYAVVSLIEGQPLVLATSDMQPEDWTKVMKAIADHLGITAAQFTERSLEKQIKQSQEVQEQLEEPPSTLIEEAVPVSRNNSSDYSANPMSGSCTPCKAAGSKGKPSAKAGKGSKPTSKSPAKQH